MKAPTLRHLAAALAIVVLAPVALHAQKSKSWSEFLGGPESAHYSPLKQITTANVNKLAVAWSYETGDGVAYTFCPLLVEILPTSPQKRVPWSRSMRPPERSCGSTSSARAGDSAALLDSAAPTTGRTRIAPTA